MKTLTLALTTLILSAPAFAAENGFTCESRWYREAELSVNSGAVSVKDSYMTGLTEVAKIMEKKLKLEDGKFMVNTIGLTVTPNDGISCQTTGLLVSCEGRAPKAWLEVSGWIHADGLYGHVVLTLPVEVKDFSLRTSLGSPGPIKLAGDKPVSVQLNRLSLDARAAVVLEGQDVNLAWQPFFNSRNEGTSGSFCRKY